MFPEVRVPDDAPLLPEPLGSKRKFWFQNVASVMYLFKEVQPNTGEDWSEKVACELCRLLDLPHVDYDFAICRGRKGVVCPTCVPTDGRLVHGNELLAQVVPSYPQQQYFRVSQHTLENVFAILQSPEVKTPLAWLPLTDVFEAVDVFVGYLMFDAWIANTDRHHENWALVVSPEASMHLAPSYDHASSLGAHETDTNRYDRLTTRDTRRSMERYVERATSAFFASLFDTTPMSTFDAFHEAGIRRPAAAKAWLERLASLSFPEIQVIFANIPSDRISVVQ
jgi:hypothetical protein